METYDIDKFINGDEEVFRVIYDKEWKKVYDFTRIYIKDEFESEEIVQEVFIRLWRMRRRIDRDKSIDGLLFIITRNIIFNSSRKSLNKEACLSVIAQATDEACDSMQSQIEADDMRNYISELVDMMPPRQRETFLLSRRGLLSNKEIASQLHISVKGVERNLYLALRFLRKNLPLYVIFSGL